MTVHNMHKEKPETNGMCTIILVYIGGIHYFLSHHCCTASFHSSGLLSERAYFQTQCWVLPWKMSLYYYCACHQPDILGKGNLSHKLLWELIYSTLVSLVKLLAEGCLHKGLNYLFPAELITRFQMFVPGQSKDKGSWDSVLSPQSST